MNPVILAARDHYYTLPPQVKDRVTAKHLMAVIQEAERMECGTISGEVKNPSRKIVEIIVDAQTAKA